MEHSEIPSPPENIYIKKDWLDSPKLKNQVEMSTPFQFEENINLEKEIIKADEFTKYINHVVSKYETIGTKLDETLTKIGDENSETDLSDETTKMQNLFRRLKKLSEDFRTAVEKRRQKPKKELPEEPKERVLKAIEILDESVPDELLPTVGLLGDTDKIEGHQIDILADEESVCAMFKTTSTHGREIRDRLSQKTFSSSLPIENSRYWFRSLEGNVYEPSDCWVIRLNQDTKIYVSKALRHGKEIMSMIGAVKIEISNIRDPKKILGELQAAFNILEIPGCFESPDEEALRNYKEARTRWHHKLDDGNEYLSFLDEYKKETGVDFLEHVKREEVFPGYFTLVDHGASERYQKPGKIYVVHKVYLDETLPSILNHGLLASHERYKRGIHKCGMSTSEDFETGGADSVFLRAITDIKRMSYYSGDLVLVIDETELDRTDWYAYNSDEYGKTEPVIFSTRLAPVRFFQALRESYNVRNELMFRRGVAKEKIKYIVVGYNGKEGKEERQRIIKLIRKAGITKFNNIPIERIVITLEEFMEKQKNG